MEKQRYASFRNTNIPAGKIWNIPVYGSAFRVLYNSLTINPQVSIDSGPLYEIASGIGPKKLETFSKLSFRNPSASVMSLWIAVTEGEIDDSRAAFSEEIAIKDSSDALETPASTRALDLAGWLIDNAAAVDKGGGLVGIPVTGHQFADGESVTITGTTNYNGAHVIVSHTADELVITATYNAETFDGVDDTIAPSEPRSVAANSNRKELIIHNHDASYKVYYGDANIDPANYRGIPIAQESAHILANTAQIYFAAEAGSGVDGCIVSYAEQTKT